MRAKSDKCGTEKARGSTENESRLWLINGEGYEIELQSRIKPGQRKKIIKGRSEKHAGKTKRTAVTGSARHINQVLGPRHNRRATFNFHGSL